MQPCVPHLMKSGYKNQCLPFGKCSHIFCVTIVLRQPEISLLKELYRTRGNVISQILFDTEFIILHGGKSDGKAILTVPEQVRVDSKNMAIENCRFMEITGKDWKRTKRDLITS